MNGSTRAYSGTLSLNRNKDPYESLIVAAKFCQDNESTETKVVFRNYFLGAYSWNVS